MTMTFRRMLLLLLATLPVTAVADSNAAATLDKFHQAASDADGQTYFDLFTSDGVFIGTDASERWTVDAFKAYAHPHFSKGNGWTYRATERHFIPISDKALSFDEMLWNDKYGVCRGTGVVVLTTAGWKIKQYHLSFPIPNGISGDITKMIQQHTQENASEH